MTNSMESPDVTPLTDDEMLDILRQVQSGALSTDQAEVLLRAGSAEQPARQPNTAALLSQDFSALLGKTANGKLSFERGAVGLTLAAKPLPGQLYKAHFERHVPVVRVNGGAVTVRYRDFGFGLLNWLRYGFNTPRSELTLNADIPWQIDIHGGIAQSGLDLRLAKLRQIVIHSGASEVKLVLGEPDGEVNVECHGGVHNLIILRPAPVATRLTVHGGASNLTLDQQTLGAVGGMTVLETPNNQEANHYYNITIHGGAQNLKVATL